MKHIILAPDSFKGTMSAQEICQIQTQVIHAYYPQCRVDAVPMADGGEGMSEAYYRLFGGEAVELELCGPRGRTAKARYIILPDQGAVMEMAAAAGLPMMEGARDIENATTRGVGEMLLDAQKRGVKRILLGLGGSATNDCGIGMAAALGYRFTDENGAAVEPLAKNMLKIKRIVKPERALDVQITAACDVDNPLYGPDGATYTFGMQKGANDIQLAALDAGLKNMAQCIRADLGIDVANVAGAGAAGGLGAAVIAFLGGTLSSGIELLLEAAHFDELLCDCDLVITGEGRIDWQSAHGKVPYGVGMRAKKAGVPCVALCGSAGKNAEAVYEYGITAIFTAVCDEASFEDVKKSCRADMRLLTDALMRFIMALRGKNEGGN